LNPLVNLAKMRNILGMVNYYGYFIPKFVSETKPLIDLTVKDIAWKLGKKKTRDISKTEKIYKK